MLHVAVALFYGMPVFMFPVKCGQIVCELTLFCFQMQRGLWQASSYCHYRHLASEKNRAAYDEFTSLHKGWIKQGQKIQRKDL
jgi:hypothetical protein